MQPDFKAVKRYATPEQMPTYYPFVKKGGLRAWIFNAQNNGFSQCLKERVPNNFRNFLKYYFGILFSFVKSLGNYSEHVPKRIGRKILVDLDKFEAWVDGQNRGGK